MIGQLVDISDEPTWLGAEHSPLFGWLSRPISSEVLGGVVIVPSVGYEARSAKGALRVLAWELARAGFVTLRFDLHGTGDSARDFDEMLPSPDWVDDVGVAVDWLHSFGIDSVSVVGMRLGATLAVEAASNDDVDVSSLVLWDPCESGRSYLRELRALETLRRVSSSDSGDGSVETSEFLFSRDMAAATRELKLEKLAHCNGVERTLVITRSTRPLSPTLQAHLVAAGASFEVTNEQDALLSVMPFDAEVPTVAITGIVNWLLEKVRSQTLSVAPVLHREALLRVGDGVGVRERATFIGEQGLFAILSEPEQPSPGPWIILIGNIHDDHTGQSRMWVELSRRWSRSGLRCARVDLSGLGESSRPNSTIPIEKLDLRWLGDIATIGRVLDPKDPTNNVLVGFCAVAPIAREGALTLGSKGVCTINPSVGRNVMHAILRLQLSDSRTLRRVAKALKIRYARHPWVVSTVWESVRKLIPRPWSEDILDRLHRTGTDVFVLGNNQDYLMFSQVPVVRSLEGRRKAKQDYPVIVIPDLDHSMTIASGRDQMVTILDEHVRRTYACDRRK